MAGHTPGLVLEREGATASSIAEKIIAFLDKAQARDLRRDEGGGLRSARLVGQAVGVDKSEARVALEQLAEAGRVLRQGALNGLFWRSITPLPWEAGGSLTAQRERERELWAGELSLVVQAGWADRAGKYWRDVKAYPAALREQAEAHVRLENSQSEERRKRARWNNHHLNDTYSPPPIYRLVALQTVSAALSKAEGK